MGACGHILPGQLTMNSWYARSLSSMCKQRGPLNVISDHVMVVIDKDLGGMFYQK